MRYVSCNRTTLPRQNSEKYGCLNIGTGRPFSGYGIVLLVLCFPALFIATDTALATDYQQARLEMVRMQIKERGVRHEPTLAALEKVPRHKFVPPRMTPYAYQDRPLPIGYGQTISQPYIVGYMTEVLQPEPDFKVLEIGTGSGYQAAVLAEIVDTVYTIEIIEELAVAAKKRLQTLGYDNIKAIRGDGYYGWEKAAPFDAIIVTAAAEFIPPPLIAQLKSGGKMIIPVGSPFGVQWLMLVTKEDDAVTTRRLSPVRFVPLTRD
jgi:protein-L-isoaspartate(D-aspartate) O-methyltransferase